MEPSKVIEIEAPDGRKPYRVGQIVTLYQPVKRHYMTIRILGREYIGGEWWRYTAEVIEEGQY